MINDYEATEPITSSAAPTHGSDTLSNDDVISYLNGLIETGNPDHAGLLATGFGRIEDVQGVAARRIAERARVLAPLDVPEPLELRLGMRALEGPVLARVSVNGHEIGRVDVLPDNWQEPRLLAPAALWRRELNDVVIEADGGPLALREVRFVRSERP